jgi:ribosomal protein L21E
LKGIIDRFEGNIVVVEIDGSTKDFPKMIFPIAAKTGDVVEIKGHKVTVLNSETDKLRKEIEDLMNEVWED